MTALVLVLAIWAAVWTAAEVTVQLCGTESRWLRACAHLSLFLGREPAGFASRQARHLTGIIREIWPR